MGRCSAARPSSDGEQSGSRRRAGAGAAADSAEGAGAGGQAGEARQAENPILRTTWLLDAVNEKLAREEKKGDKEE